MISKIGGRGCCVCRGIPAHEATYDVDYATVIEKYCDAKLCPDSDILACIHSRL